MRRSLSAVVHGESGTGKSWFGDTAPKPSLVIDVEGGVQFTPSRKVGWDPRVAPPEADGSWDTCVVSGADLAVIPQVADWLTQAPHPFRSVRIDSLSEVQSRIMNQIAGPDQLKQQDWGTVWRKTDWFVRRYRDLTITNPDGSAVAMNPYPVEVVLFICGSTEKGRETGVLRPMLSGQAAEKIPYYVDAVGHLTVIMDEQGQLERRMLFAPVNNVAAKDRTGRLGVYMDAPTIPKVLDTIYGPEAQTEGGS